MLVGVIQDYGVLFAAIRDTLKEESKKEIQDTKDTTFPLTTAVIGLLRMGSWQLMGPLSPPAFHAPTRRVLTIPPEKEKWLQVVLALVFISVVIVAPREVIYGPPRKRSCFHALVSLQALFGHFFKGLIDHLVSNHKQLLSIERENHKVNCSLHCYSFMWSRSIHYLHFLST